MGEVSFDAAGVTYIAPDGVVRRVAWSDLQAVALATTADGPFAEDVFWALRGADATVSVPQSAGGSDALLARLQELSGFDSGAVISAMLSAREAQFPCWSRGPAK